MGRLSSKGGVRPIPRNYRSLTGKVSFQKDEEAQPFESSLERDFYRILDFDSQVTSATAQPLTVSYETKGKTRGYIPDVAVYYQQHQPVVYEIKYRADLSRQWSESIAKFKAAVRHCKSHGMLFKIITEKEIRGGSIQANIKFLRGFRDISVEYGVKKRLVDSLRILGPCATPRVLLEATYDSQEWKLRGMPVLWHLLASRTVEFNHFSRLTMNSHVWLSEKTPCPMPLSLALRQAR